MADREKVMRLLKTARGQLDGIIKMVDEDRYCIDISNQLMATQAMLKTINREVLAAHLKSCVMTATADDMEQKTNELVSTIDKLLK